MNIGIIIQARLGSSRLPGKSLMHVDSSYSVLEYVEKYPEAGMFGCLLLYPAQDDNEDY